jgi:methylmalonyl-CoA/ethylmalonyl-CoA epimerase
LVFYDLEWGLGDRLLCGSANFCLESDLMKLGRLNHIGVATPSIEASVAFWRDVMGATQIGAPFDMAAQGVRVCFVETPGEGGTAGTQIELLEPLGEASPIAGFLEKNPQGGQHPMAYEVPDIEAARAWFEEQGKRVLGEPRLGAHGTLVFFLHPKDMNGVLTEIMEEPKGESH